MPFLDVQGGRLYYETSGQGSPVVFIHAGIADHRMWEPQWEEFAAHHRVVRYDTRRYGQTTTEDVPYSNRADLRELLDHLGIERAAVIGCSRGGQIAADFTIEFPERVSALVLSCAGLGGATFETSDEDAIYAEASAAEEAGDWARVIELDVQVWVDGFGRPQDAASTAHLEPIRALVREMEWASIAHNDEGGQPIVLDPPAAGRLGEMRLPALVLVGDYDTVGTKYCGDAYAAGIAGAQLVRLPTAHLPNLERPAEFNQRVLAFLTSAVG